MEMQYSLSGYGNEDLMDMLCYETLHGEWEKVPTMELYDSMMYELSCNYYLTLYGTPDDPDIDGTESTDWEW